MHETIITHSKHIKHKYYELINQLYVFFNLFRANLNIYTVIKISKNYGLYNEITCDNRSITWNVEMFHSKEQMSQGK